MYKPIEEEAVVDDVRDNEGLEGNQSSACEKEDNGILFVAFAFEENTYRVLLSFSTELLSWFRNILLLLCRCAEFCTNLLKRKQL